MQDQAHNVCEAINGFLRIAQNDVRLSPTHISLYFVLFSYWLQNDNKNPFAITRKVVMQFSKIKSIATYHKCISDLHRYGYLIYTPSFHPANGSSVYLKYFDPLY